MAKQTFTTGQVLTAAQMTSLQQTAMGGGAPVTKTGSYVLAAADAGTVIQMNAAGATTITVNTSLFSAGDTVQIQNIGAGVCTITAGTATVTTAGSLALSQWEGGFLYFTSASAAIFFDVVQSSGMTNPMTTDGDTIYGGASGTPTRLAVGTAGQVLTVNAGATAPEWKTASSTPTFAGVSVYKSANQSINNTTFTVLTFNTESFDTNAYHDNSTNTSRITIPSGKGGYYNVSATLSFGANNTGIRQLNLLKNGSAVLNMFGTQGSTGDYRVSGSTIISLVAGDYIEVNCYQSSGGALDAQGFSTETTFSAFLIGA